MAKEHLPDKLAVIVHADIADSTRLVQRDEHLAHIRIRDAFDLLKNCGINFGSSDSKGVDINNFAELLMTSGLVLCENIRWISFHRCANSQERL